MCVAVIRAELSTASKRPQRSAIFATTDDNAELIMAGRKAERDQPASAAFYVLQGSAIV